MVIRLMFQLICNYGLSCLVPEMRIADRPGICNITIVTRAKISTKCCFEVTKMEQRRTLVEQLQVVIAMQIMTLIQHIADTWRIRLLKDLQQNSCKAIGLG
jgi:hypothetical protein